MRTWNLIWISMISLALAFPASARVDWFPDDVQDALPELQTKEEALPNSGPPTECAADDESCPKHDESSNSQVGDGQGRGDSAGGDSDGDSRASDSEDRDSEDGDSEDDDSEDSAFGGTNEMDNLPASRAEGIRGPRPPTGVDFEPPSWLKSLLDSLKDLEFPDWTGTALKTLGWILVGILILMALAGLLRVFWPRKHPKLPDVDEDSLLNELQARTKNRQANELAKVQDFNLAIHALLLDALRRLENRHPIIRSPSATGREIALEIDPSPLSALLHLVKASEMCVFAVSIADEELYHRAEEWHRAIVSGL